MNLRPLNSCVRFLFDRTGLVRRINPVYSLGLALLAGSVVAVADEPVWTEKGGKILRDGEVFAETGLEFPLSGLIGGQNGSVIVGQPTELTQIFDEDGDGKGDFFRALVGNFPSGNRIVSGPLAGADGELFIGVSRAGKSLDLVSWRAGEGGSHLVFSMPASASNLAINTDNVLAAVISDPEGDWIGRAQLWKARKEETPTEETGNEGTVPAPPEGATPIRALPVEESETPILKPAVRLPKSLIGDGNHITGLTFSETGEFELKTSDDRKLKISVETVEGEIQGSAVPLPKMDDDFAVSAIKLVTDGFEISLTKPVDRGVAGIDPVPFQILSRPLVGVNQMIPIAIKSAVVEPDGLTINMIPDILLPKQVYLFDLSALKSEDGEALQGEKAAYTVIAIPLPTVVPPVIEETSPEKPAETVETEAPKAETE